jgi:hypothetical protein
MKGVTNIYKITHLVISNNLSINQSKLLFTNKILITLSPFDLFPRIPNALEMTLPSTDVKLHANDWKFLKLSAVEPEIDNIVCEISSLMTENIKFITM